MIAAVPVVTGHGWTSLAAMGQPVPIVLKAGRWSAPGPPYRLPHTSGRSYYVIRARFRVRVLQRTGNGFGFVEVRTGKGVSVSTKFKIRRVAGAPVTTWSNTTTEGTATHRTRRTTIDVDVVNYVRYVDTAPGQHRLRFTVQRYGSLRFGSVTVMPSSGMRMTQEPPFTLSMTAHAEAGQTPVVGRDLPIAVRLTNSGRVTARQVRVHADASAAVRVLDAGSFERWYPLPGRRSRERRLRVVPTRPGVHELGLIATSSKGGARGVVRIEVAPAEVTGTASSADGQSSDGESTLGAALVAGASILAAVTLMMARRLRHRP